MTNTEANSEKAATVAAQGAHVAPTKASPKKGASKKTGAPKNQRAANAGKPKAAAQKKQAKAGKKAAKPACAKGPRPPRAESKGALILDLLSRAKGCYADPDHGLRFTLHLARMMRGILTYLVLPW